MSILGDDIPRLETCLRSVIGQSQRDLQVVLVDASANPKVAAACGKHLKADKRLVAVRCDTRSAGAARNKGVEKSTGRYLVFVDVNATLPMRAAATMTAALDASGADLASGTSLELRDNKLWSPDWAVMLDTARHTTSVQDSPYVAYDLALGSKFFRRSFWQSAALSFDEGAHDNPQETLVRALAEAEHLDVVPTVTYQEHTDDSRQTFAERSSRLTEVASLLATLTRATQVADARLSDVAQRVWRCRVLEVDLLHYIEAIPWEGDEYWNILQQGVFELLRHSEPEMLADLPNDVAVKAWLIRDGRREQLQQFLADRVHEKSHQVTEVVDGRIFGRLPFIDDPAVDVPRELYALRRRQTPLIGSLSAARWKDDGSLELDAWAYVPYLDLSDVEPELRVILVERTTGERRELSVERQSDPRATRAAAQRHQNVDRSAFRVRVDAAVLAEHAEPMGSGKAGPLTRWQMQIEFVAKGVRREGLLTRRDSKWGAGYLSAMGFGDLRVAPIVDQAQGFLLEIRRPAAVIRQLSMNNRVVSGSIHTSGKPFGSIRATASVGSSISSPIQTEGGVMHFAFRLPEIDWRETPLNGRYWTLEVSGPGARKAQRISWPSSLPVEWLSDGTSAALAAMRTERHNVELREALRIPVIEDVGFSEGRIRISGRWIGPVPEEWSAELRDHRLCLRAENVSVEADLFEITFATSFDEWGRGPRPLPHGTYTLEVVLGAELSEEGAGGCQEVAEDVAHGTKDIVADRRLAILPRLQAALLDRQQPSYVGATHRMEARRGAANSLSIEVAAPLTDEELGVYRQQQLQLWYADGSHEVETTSILFQCYRGETASDSALAIHRELMRREAPYTLYWSVSDLSVSVPDGAVPVLMRSREWYGKLASVRYLVNNIDFDRYFAKKPYQRYLQTFHGQPFKSMGISLWSNKGLSADQIDREVLRRTSAWDVILTPSGRMNAFYRREYRYTGEILDVGYPRNDILLGERGEAVRQATRERLGIVDDQKVIIYAPTWRDTVAITAWSAALTSFLDLERASEELGEDYVLLMRGHNYIARTPIRSQRTARIIDVTDYPEVNELILASDAAVLDYSSLRFDYAITGKPMLFLVPDLKDFSGTRGQLFDYADSAPGPFLHTSDEVIARLADLDWVRRSYSEQYAKFNRSFNSMHDGHAAERVVDGFFDQSR